MGIFCQTANATETVPNLYSEKRMQGKPQLLNQLIFFSINCSFISPEKTHTCR